MNTTAPVLNVTPVKKTPWYAIPVIVCIVLSMIYVSKKIRTVETASVNAKLVWVTGGNPQSGDMVTFSLTHPVIPTEDNTVKVTKILVCTQGQTLIRLDNQWTCDGKQLGENRVFAMNGDELEQFYFNGQIPQGKGFVMGDGENSFDSRYWGFVQLSEVTVVTKVI